MLRVTQIAGELLHSTFFVQLYFSITPGKRGTYCQGYLGFAKMYLELLELLLELLLQLLLELLLLLLLSWLPRAW